jgi:oligopeptide transport system permease protein
MTTGSLPTNAPAAPSLPEAERYASLLQEALALKGVSLWQDAWRRLRRNRAAMTSLYFLVALSSLAVFTPLIPLQSPLDKDLRGRVFLAPWPPSTVKLGNRDDLNFASRSLELELAAYRDTMARLRRQETEAQDEAELQRLQREIAQRRLNDDPLRKLWNNPGPVTALMLRTRVALFGDWCIPSFCGTDALGRDVLSRIFWGARVSLMVGIVATFVSLIIGVSYGAIAGYVGGWVDSAMMRVVDILYSIPFIFVVIYLMTFLSAEEVKTWLDARGIDQIVIFYLVIGAIYWLTMSRVVRGQVLSLKNEQFIEAARVLGASRARIVFRHLIPNVLGVVIVYLTLTIPAVMLFEAFLSFLGLGVSPPDVSWGLLVNEGIEVITPIKIYWWLVLFPGLTLAGTLFALNFLGDGLRDALDPRLKNLG